MSCKTRLCYTCSSRTGCKPGGCPGSVRIRKRPPLWIHSLVGRTPRRSALGVSEFLVDNPCIDDGSFCVEGDTPMSSHQRYKLRRLMSPNCDLDPQTGGFARTPEGTNLRGPIFAPLEALKDGIQRKPQSRLTQPIVFGAVSELGLVLKWEKGTPINPCLGPVLADTPFSGTR